VRIVLGNWTTADLLSKIPVFFCSVQSISSSYNKPNIRVSPLTLEYGYLIIIRQGHAKTLVKNFYSRGYSHFHIFPGKQECRLGKFGWISRGPDRSHACQVKDSHSQSARTTTFRTYSHLFPIGGNQEIIPHPYKFTDSNTTAAYNNSTPTYCHLYSFNAYQHGDFAHSNTFSDTFTIEPQEHFRSGHWGNCFIGYWRGDFYHMAPASQ
jgi:hypothetical protein